MAILDFTKLEAWQKATDLAVKIREITGSFPKEEQYGVVSQIRRASVSIGSNIAEGFGRYTYPDKKHKYVEARGELIEVMSLLHYCERVRYISKQILKELLNDCNQRYEPQSKLWTLAPAASCGESNPRLRPMLPCYFLVRRRPRACAGRRRIEIQKLINGLITSMNKKMEMSASTNCP